MSGMSVFLWAVFGGAFCELLHWVGIRRRSNYFPQYARNVGYWVITILLILAGGILAVAVNLAGTALTPLTASVFGYSAPTLIHKLVKAAPTPELGTKDKKTESAPSAYGFLIG